MSPLLSVEHLTIQAGDGGPLVVDNLSFALPAGEMLALVGESGSGKTMAARAVLDLLPPPMRRVGGHIRFDGQDLAALPPKGLRRIRGARIGMVFQEPMVSLNPAMPIGRQMAEALKLHLRLDDAEIRRRSLAMLERIQIADPERCLAAYPHEFSGGMRQRIMLASVMLTKPALLIADEPTTALDTLVQREVLDLMVELTRENGTAVLMISHDLAMVARYARHVVVLQRGRAVDGGPTEQVLLHPRDDYTRRLLDALPKRGPARPPVDRTVPLLAVENVTIDHAGRQRLFSRSAAKRAVDGVSLAIHPGETLALVGGSGSGKTTLGRAIIGLKQPSGGRILFRGQEVHGGRGPGARDHRLNCQMIFQDPYSSLDPRMKIGAIVAEPLRLAPEMSARQKADRLAETLADCGLSPEHAGRYAHQLSGGQRQRVAIARAIIRRPALVIADEPVSALDMTVQKQILELFRSLQERYGFACLFVSHDLGAVEQVADRVAVMQSGKIVETGPRDTVFDHPQHDYTRELLAAAPSLHRLDGGGFELKGRRIAAA
ncbi:peptide/nickel transport system ATP-binding protein [Inquilinus ginsengisoli]|uniref:Peptide/nickel transport system ATP-binding protein n=1 Tax=Inquilinus ginsengisoli TaxID=363840 RepID=A0ABU1JNN2_9PROT|nr:ABC transporter ATP-binding protein [Inquilinus ginsengisoli]MDR6290229.1 peptide/nickel transport system ATP-binding protein [Inquilinus ginsengisoli]